MLSFAARWTKKTCLIYPSTKLMLSKAHTNFQDLWEKIPDSTCQKTENVFDFSHLLVYLKQNRIELNIFMKSEFSQPFPPWKFLKWNKKALNMISDKITCSHKLRYNMIFLKFKWSSIPMISHFFAFISFVNDWEKLQIIIK